jgi:hypothetical protein
MRGRRGLGADPAINYRKEDFVAATKAVTGGKGADVILDMVGGDYIERNYEGAAVEGRVVQIAFQAGSGAAVDFRRSCSTADAYGLDAARTFGRRQGRDRAACGGARAAPHCRGQGATLDRQHLSALAGKCRARAHGNERAHRQDRADPLRSLAGRLQLVEFPVFSDPPAVQSWPAGSASSFARAAK